jgi:hypothetical protein
MTNIFSFRRGSLWSQGTIWNWGGKTDGKVTWNGPPPEGDPMIQEGTVFPSWGGTDRLSYSLPYDAYKGVYNMKIDPNDKDILLIRVAFTRGYQVESPGKDPTELDWKRIDRFVPVGCILEIPLDDGKIPEKKMAISGKKPFWVDEAAMEIQKRDEPYTILEKLTGVGELRKCANRDFKVFEIGHTFNCTKWDLSKDILGQYPPPSFKLLKEREE